ncbi:MAG: hypothetical protein EA397_11335 [Deltaproteobacteria bacterium]|nr:MAG: hypothetical protein EA397_11335 [Deltaproteobacteria bacterium]
MPRLIVFGAGALGGEIARRWVADGGEAIGVTRTEARHEALAEAGVQPALAEQPPAHTPDDVILFAVSGSEGQHEAALRLDGPRPQRVVMASTTGYFAELSGEVGPQTAAGPSRRAQRAARAEGAVRGLADCVVIVRLGGLYRLGRGPVQALLRRGSPPPGPPDRPLALLHYADAATALLGALRHPEPDPVYLALTPPLPTREAFYRLACARHGLPAPRFTEPTEGTPLSYDIRSLRRDLLPTPAYPDWREAIRAP